MKTSEQTWDVVVIGGGPAGMIAAGRAGERGRRVLLLEKNPTLGKKLLISGGGRCNLTNASGVANVRTMLARYKKSDQFLFSAFAQFGVPETLTFFNSRGMATKEEEEGRIFPISNKSQSVWDVLFTYMQKNGVEVRTNAEVTNITFDKNNDEIIVALGKGREVRTRACVVGTGGTSHPETGSTGEGFSWLKKLGHTVDENDMALVPIALKDAWVKKVSGVTLKDIKLTTFKNGAKQKVYKGKLLFTHVGVSGPTVLNMSKDVGELLAGDEGSSYLETVNPSTGSGLRPKGRRNQNEVTVMLDLFPTLDSGALKEKLQTLLIQESNKKIKNTLTTLVPSALVAVVLELAGIDGETANNVVRSEQRKGLLAILKAIPLHVRGLLGKDKAIVSSGGVSLREVNFKTMQSRIIPQLYLVGDVLNIDRPSGGYSLQLCWTTGYVAGNSC